MGAFSLTKSFGHMLISTDSGMVNAWIRDALMNHPLYQSKFIPGLLRGSDDSARRAPESLRSPEMAEMLSFEALSMLGLPLRGPLRASRSQLASPSQQTPVALLKKTGHSDGGRKPRNSSSAIAELPSQMDDKSPKEHNFPPRESRDSRSGSRSPSPSLPAYSRSASPDNNGLVINHHPLHNDQQQLRSPQMLSTSNPGK